MHPTELHQAYVFDLDGTIYLGDHLLPGAARQEALGMDVRWQRR